MQPKQVYFFYKNLGLIYYKHKLFWLTLKLALWHFFPLLKTLKSNWVLAVNFVEFWSWSTLKRSCSQEKLVNVIRFFLSYSKRTANPVVHFSYIGNLTPLTDFNKTTYIKLTNRRTNTLIAVHHLNYLRMVKVLSFLLQFFI